MRDWWKSIFGVATGDHARLPGDVSRPFWERFALMDFWIRRDTNGPIVLDHRNDPGQTLGEWRRTKLLRGLLRHLKRAFA